ASQTVAIAEMAAAHNQGVVAGIPKNLRDLSVARPPDGVALGLSTGSWVVAGETAFCPPVSLAAGSGCTAADVDSGIAGVAVRSLTSATKRYPRPGTVTM